MNHDPYKFCTSCNKIKRRAEFRPLPGKDKCLFCAECAARLLVVDRGAEGRRIPVPKRTKGLARKAEHPVTSALR
jgi:hypothetical protein